MDSVSLYKFVLMVRDMRFWQKKYFKDRKGTNLSNAKWCESQVDEMLENLKPNEIEKALNA